MSSGDDNINPKWRRSDTMRSFQTLKIGTLFLAALLLMAGCATESKTRKGAAYGAAGGAAAGAIAGQAIGGDSEATLLGAGIGAAVGGLAGAGVGAMMDRQERELREELAASEAAAVRREGNLLAITLRGDVTFDTGSAEVNPGLYPEIDRISRVLTQYPSTRIRVEGHTDSVGSEESNQELSRRRAEAVKALLVQDGVRPGRITTQAFGESMPVSGNDTPYGRQQNRRVEIKIEPTG